MAKCDVCNGKISFLGGYELYGKAYCNKCWEKKEYNSKINAELKQKNSAPYYYTGLYWIIGGISASFLYYLLISATGGGTYFVFIGAIFYGIYRLMQNR